MAELRAGVVGAGVFGTFHARKYASLPGVELAGVFDPDPARAGALAGELGVQAFPHLDGLLEASHVVSVATPAHAHAEGASHALAAGRHVYVEKPLAVAVEPARRLVAEARDRRLVLACGHQERVSFAAMGMLDAPEVPLALKSVRRGAPNDRNRDVSCVLDLMIHDLDLVLALSREGWVSVEAQGEFDEVRAEILFRGGLHARFQASRIAERRARVMTLNYRSGEVDIDFLAPSFRSTAGVALRPDFAATPQGRDPLGASIEGFLAAVRGDAARPVVTGDEGLAALELALAVERAAGLQA